MGQTICSAEQCPKSAVARGLCGTHWARWRRSQGALLPRPTTCAVPDCERGGKLRRGWCEPHYERWKKYGDPTHERTAPTIHERFWSKVLRAGPTPEHRPDLGSCWTWLGSLNSHGYGQFYPVHGPPVASHRFMYELVVGPIPAGLTIDHLCWNTACCNPAHMEPVTRGENARRADGGAHNRAKTHCPRGHAYDAANTYTYRGGRHCRACGRMRTAS